MTPFLISLLLCAEPACSELKTPHYELRVETLDAAEVGRMLEDLHAQLTGVFGKAPAGRLRVEIYADIDRYKEALARDRQQYLGGGGYYAPGNRKAYVFLQPSEYYTRQLILHESTHQFHLLTAAGNKLPKASWFVEGIAEYFGMHNWDGRQLRTGVVPAVSLEDYPANALKQFDACGRDLQGIVFGRVDHRRVMAWALVHFLMSRHRQRFLVLAAKLNEEEDLAPAWARVFGKITPKFAAEFREWIVQNPQPWQSVWISWQQVGDAMEGHSQVTGLAVLKETPQSLEAEMELVDGTLKAGLAFGFQSPDSFFLLQVVNPRLARVVQRAGAQWKLLGVHLIPAAKGRNRVALSREGDQVTLAVNGQRLRTVAAPGQVGLNVDNCRVRFRVNLKSQNP